MTFDPAAQAATLGDQPRGRSRNKKATDNAQRNQESAPDQGAAQVVETAAEPPQVAQPQAGGLRSGATVVIELPADTCDCGYTQVWINFRASARQAAALKVLWCSLRRRHERFHQHRMARDRGAGRVTLDSGSGPRRRRFRRRRQRDALSARSGDAPPPVERRSRRGNDLGGSSLGGPADLDGLCRNG